MRRAVLVLVAGVLPIGAFAQVPDAQSICLPYGPPPAEGYQPYEEAIHARGQKVIAGVPAYLWHHGCGPTAAGMVIGYWDIHSCPLLIPGDASTQTAEVNEAMASAAHYNDYSMPIDDPGTGLLLDKSSLGGAHSPHNCLGDFMNTSWSSRTNYYGWSWYSDMDDALLGYTNIYVNNTYGASYTATAWNETWGAFTWAEFVGQIDADRPMVFLVDSNGDGATDHFVPAFGYRDINGYPEYACFDTWAYGVRWERFRSMSASYSWGIYGATFYNVQVPVGACCLADGACQQLSETDCAGACGTYYGDGSVCWSGLCILRGDLNCDGAVDFGDINPFVLYLSNNAAWQAAYPDCSALNGDIDGDGTYGQWSFGDINPFVALLTGG
jgi:hypothetical protein